MGTQFVHSLNGSGLAVPRVWAGIVETYRQPDGSVKTPRLCSRIWVASPRFRPA